MTATPLSRPLVGALLASCLLAHAARAAEPGSVTISGELKLWHSVTLTVQGPYAVETDTDPNPFTDYCMTVTFKHASGAPAYAVPGHFAADGQAAETSADAGTAWRARLAPDKPGEWSYVVAFTKGPLAAVEGGGEPLPPYHGRSGTFWVAPSDKAGRDFRAKGRLCYVGRRYLQFAGTGDYFLKAGADAPETLLAYADFDGTEARKKSAPLKTWSPHARDWREGDPSWQNGKGKGLIGALNYLAGAGCNAASFLTYNAGGDGDNVWPFVKRDDPLHYDCSKLDQWGVVFDHATALGLFLHFKTQETENDDRKGSGAACALDGGDLGVARKLYYRELTSRFGHALALNWNLGEENSQSAEQQRAMARHFHAIDPYRHPVVIHTYPNEQEKVYAPLLGDASLLAGASLQNGWSAAHRQTLRWVAAAEDTVRPWVICSDEQNPAGLGVPPDPGYADFDGQAQEKGGRPYTLHDIRKLTLWGSLLAGGAGTEYYFGYRLPQNDLLCEDWRSRDQSWAFCRIALGFFRDHAIPFWEMRSEDGLIGNATSDNSRYCFAKRGEVYLVYLPAGGSADLDLRAALGSFDVSWFNPRAGGPLQSGATREVAAGGTAALGAPPADPEEDWLVLIRRRDSTGVRVERP